MTTHKEYKCFEFDNRIEEFIDAREGVLLDSYIGVDRWGFLVCCIVTFVSPWSSCYTVYQSECEADDDAVWEVWNDFVTAYDAEYPPED